MPKIYSQIERDRIIGILKKESLECMSLYGIRKTTVDELVRRAGIPKGTFYLFYKSKEELLFEVLRELHNQINSEMAASMASLNFKGDLVEQMTERITHFFLLIEQYPILRKITAQDIELMIRKLPAGVVEEHLGEDMDQVELIFSKLPVRKGVDLKAVSAAFHEIYFGTVFRNEIDQDSYTDGLNLLIRGILVQTINQD